MVPCVIGAEEEINIHVKLANFSHHNLLVRQLSVLLNILNLERVWFIDNELFMSKRFYVSFKHYIISLLRNSLMLYRRLWDGLCSFFLQLNIFI